MKGFERDADVVARIRDDIGMAAFPPGTRLIETELAARYGVPRSVVRDALVQVAAEGLIEREPNRVATVRAFTIDEAVQVAEARRELESLHARYAARRATPGERAEIIGLLGIQRSHEAEAGLHRYRDASLAFHSAISAAARHPTASEFLARLRNHRLDLHFPDAFPTTAAPAVRFHEAIAEAIAVGDDAAAEAHMFAHMDVVVQRLREYRARLHSLASA